jgi:uncharacterized protein (TIGR03084 family)
MTDLVTAATVGLDVLVAELTDERAALLAVLDEAGGDMRARRTPAVGWDIGMQLAHLAHGEELAALALTNTDAFTARTQGLMSGDLEANVNAEMGSLRELDQARLVAAWDTAAADLEEALGGRDATDRVSWVAGPMSLASFVRARVMETFAHGQDVRDGLDVPAPATPRVRHVAYLGVRTRDFSYTIRGREAPDRPVRVELAAPDDDVWTWGPDDAIERIEGPAVDFALVVTRRRHPADTALRIAGDAATEWMQLAQCYAGPPSEHRPAGSFPTGWRETIAAGAAA